MPCVLFSAPAYVVLSLLASQVFSAQEFALLLCAAAEMWFAFDFVRLCGSGNTFAKSTMKREPGCFSSFLERAGYQSAASPNFWVSFWFSGTFFPYASLTLGSHSSIVVRTSNSRSCFCSENWRNACVRCRIISRQNHLQTALRLGFKRDATKTNFNFFLKSLAVRKVICENKRIPCPLASYEMSARRSAQPCSGHWFVLIHDLPSQYFKPLTIGRWSLVMTRATYSTAVWPQS